MTSSAVPRLKVRKLRVKVDPFNAGVVYALVKGRWLRCVSQYYHFFNGRSLKEIMIASEELRKSKTNVAGSKLITAKKLRDFMAYPEEVERLKQQREKDAERWKSGLGVAPPVNGKVRPPPAPASTGLGQSEKNVGNDYSGIEEVVEI